MTTRGCDCKSTKGPYDEGPGLDFSFICGLGLLLLSLTLSLWAVVLLYTWREPNGEGMTQLAHGNAGFLLFLAILLSLANFGLMWNNCDKVWVYCSSLVGLANVLGVVFLVGPIIATYLVPPCCKA